MPKKLSLLTHIVGEGVPGIVIAIAARKNNNANFHGEKLHSTKTQSSTEPRPAISSCSWWRELQLAAWASAAVRQIHPAIQPNPA
jgi:hypothetical protein